MGVGPRDIRIIRTDSLIDIGTPLATDEVVIRDTTDGKLKFVQVSELKAASLDDIPDVTITSVADDELIAYDTGTGEWINQTPAEAGVATAGHDHTEADITNLDHLTIEEVQDNLGNSFIVGGANLTATYDDGANTLTLEVDSHNHTESQITDLDHLTIEEVQDNLGTGFIVGGTNVTVTYDDNANTLTFESTDNDTSDHGALTGLNDDDHGLYQTDDIATFAKEGTLAVTTGKGRYRIPFAATIQGVSAAVDTAPTGSAVTLDINKNGTSLGGTFEIAAGANTMTETAPSTTSVAAGDYLTVDIDAVGSTTAGADLTVFVRYRRA